MNELDIAKQASELISNLYQAGIVIVLFILFKDILAGIAKNIYIFLAIKIESKQYFSEGGLVQIDNKDYIIVDITFSKIFFKSLDGKDRVRMELSSYYKGKIKYKNIENVNKDNHDEVV